MKVVGIEKVDYVSKKTGKSVRGKKLHMCLKTENENVKGYQVESAFIPEVVECNVKVGDEVKLFYNKYGSVDAISVVSTESSN